MLNNKAPILVSLVALVCTTCAKNLEFFDVDLEPYIFNSQLAAPGQFPFSALLRIKLYDGRIGLCSGTLVHEQWVLTAGHCINIPGATIVKFEIYLGATNFHDQNEEGRVVSISRKQFTHPQFNLQLIQNDVALLKLENPVEFSATIQAVEVTENASLAAGSKVTVIGFGKLRTSDTAFSKHLQYAELVHITREECARTFPFLISREDIICAKGLNKESPCQGDSGGPLVVVENGLTFLVGQTSFGHTAGCHLGLPSGFSNTFKFVEWIRQTIAAN